MGMPRRPSVLIVGAGFGGLAVALELKRHGHHDFVILEKGDRIGGVWRENTYPGAGCDVPSVLYSYSFAPNRRWPSRFSLRDDIQQYMQDVATEYDVDRHIRFGTEVATADFDGDRGLWRIETTAAEVFEADVFVPAVGLLSRPAMPDIAGMATFAGPSFHSAEWDHAADLAGKRVAVIGNGASAAQFVPAIQPVVAQLTLFQRSAQWVIPKIDTDFRPMHHRLFQALPFVQQAERFGWWTLTELATVGLVGNRQVRSVLEWLARWQLRRQVADPELRAKLTPGYPIGCKRVITANDFLPALTQPNVHVETSKIVRITETAVVTEDGTEHPADVIIYGTGFTAADFLAPMRIRGVGGKDLREIWAEGAHAYYGMTVSNFPNMFVVYGPNTSLGAGSIIYMLERQARYIRQAVDQLARTGGSLDVRPDVENRFDEEMQGRLAGTVWAGCSSWYRDASGRIPTNWPGRVREYDRRTRHFNPADYDHTPGASHA